MLAAIALAITATLFVWIAPGPISEQRCLYTGQPDGTTVGVEFSLLPPGTECVYGLPSGETERSVYVPWMMWLVGIGGCLGAGFLCRRWAGARLKRPVSAAPARH